MRVEPLCETCRAVRSIWKKPDALCFWCQGRPPATPPAPIRKRAEYKVTEEMRRAQRGACWHGRKGRAA